MEKTLTLFELKQYLQEINRIEKNASGTKQRINNPSNLTIRNLLRYSSALSIMKTRTAGTIYQLAN
jgi:hypothetical protein